MSDITYQSFNNLLCDFVSELSQTFDEYPQLSKSNETLASLVALDDTSSLPMDTFYNSFSEYAEQIMVKDETLFQNCKIPYTESFDLHKAYHDSDSNTQEAIWNYLQQLFVTATTVKNMPGEMLSSIESVANACLSKVKSGEITAEQAQNPMFIMSQLQENPEIWKAMGQGPGPEQEPS